MITIRRTQYDTLGQISLVESMRRLREHLRTAFPEFYYRRSAAALDEFIASGIASADGFGIADETCVMRFLDYRVLFGADFPADPAPEWMLRIIADQDRDEFEKIAAIDRIQFAIESPP
jgi:hypothetical protein